jgi:hypothetical protein
MLPNTQVATYTGFMAGVAQRGTGNPYNVNGTLQIPNFSFASGTGPVLASFDGITLSGTIGKPPGTTGPSSSLVGTLSGGGVSGPLNGSIFSSPSDPAKYIAGAFGLKGSVGGTPYAAGGIFATQR